MSWQTRFGRVRISEQIYLERRTGRQVRPFQTAARVRCRGLSLGLERALTDFGADASFEKAVEKVREHYGVEVNASAVRAVTEKHGRQMQLAPEVEARMPECGVRQLLTEMDGVFVPIVETEMAEGDRRRGRQCRYAEAKLCLAGPVGSVRRRYRATMNGAEEAGRNWKACVIEAGGGRRTKLHCVGDGAAWIVRQVAEQCGAETAYLVDFYHLSEYLAAAAKVIAGPQATFWLRQAQSQMKENRWPEVLAELEKQLEPETVEAAEAPVRACWKYLSNRPEYLDYQGAIAKGLPIGSGEIESGNKNVIQSRLKIAGAWWTQENAEKMLALRVTRANGEWERYWKQQRKAFVWN